MPPTLFIRGSLVTADSTLTDVIPIDHIIDWFKQRSKIKPSSPSDRVLVLKSDTGSGKSTALPATLFETFVKPGSGGIACAQPRVLNAISIVRDLVNSKHYKTLKLGKNIGWQTGPSKRESGIGLTYMTIGVLAMQLRTMTDDDIIAKYRFIIVDEVHESSLEQLSLLFMLRNFMRRVITKSTAPFIILTSATFDAAKFLKYFDCPGEMDRNPSFISVAGFTYPLEQRFFLEQSTADYMLLAAKKATELHLENLADGPTRDILIFLPGTAEIERVREFLEDKLVDLYNQDKPLFLPLSVLSEAVASSTTEYSNVFADLSRLRVKVKKQEESQPVFRRIILSTNVAETGVTIPTLKYVIDSGLTKKPIYNPIANATALVTCAATKSMVRQRMGRANRIAPGVFVPLYPKYIFEALENMPASSVCTSNIGSTMLSLLYEHMRVTVSKAATPLLAKEYTIKIDAITTIDPIPRDQLRTALERLYACGFVSPSSNLDTSIIILETSWRPDRQLILGSSFDEVPRFNLTKMGVIAAGFHNLQPEMIRFILASYMYDVPVVDIISIVAFITTEIIIDEESLKLITTLLPQFMKDAMKDDDFLTPLIVYHQLKSPLDSYKIHDWCRECNIKSNSIITWLTAREELIETMLGNGLKISYSNTILDMTESTIADYIKRIKYCIVDGFRTNVATLSKDRLSYFTPRGLQIKKPALFKNMGEPPATFVYAGIVLKNTPGTFIFKASPTYVSPCYPDINFLNKLL